MKFLDAIFSYFGAENTKKVMQTKVAGEADVKFSALIRSIHKDMISANQSLQCVGLKYIEEFFHEIPSPESQQQLTGTIDEISDLLAQGETQKSRRLLQRLKQDIERDKRTTSAGAHFEPLMTAFDVPVLSEGEWQTKTLNVPLLALAPLSLPTIQEFTLTSKLQSLERRGEDIYVKFLPTNNSRSFWHSQKAKQDWATELTFSISPQQTDSEIEDLISHYQALLCSQQAS